MRLDFGYTETLQRECDENTVRTDLDDETVPSVTGALGAKPGIGQVNPPRRWRSRTDTRRILRRVVVAVGMAVAPLPKHFCALDENCAKQESDPTNLEDLEILFEERDTLEAAEQLW
jgi:hypothetical protein